jgi:hypothetical protein
VIENHQEKVRNNGRAGDRRLKRRFRIEQERTTARADAITIAALGALYCR